MYIVKLLKFPKFYNRRCFVMFVTAVCVLFMLNLVNEYMDLSNVGKFEGEQARRVGVDGTN